MDELNEQDVRRLRKTYKYKLKPTPEQERALAFVVRRCRELYHAALQEGGVGEVQRERDCRQPECPTARRQGGAA
jgi:hypothetical protein